MQQFNEGEAGTASIFVTNDTNPPIRLFMSDPCHSAVDANTGQEIGFFFADLQNGNIWWDEQESRWRDDEVQWAGNTCHPGNERPEGFVFVMPGQTFRMDIRLELNEAYRNIDPTTIALEPVIIGGVGREVLGPIPIQPPGGMVGWWPGDGNAEDIIGGNHGAPPFADFVEGMVQQGFGLDGISDHILVPDNNGDLNITGDVTVDLWARRTAFGAEFGNEMISKSGIGEQGNSGDAFDMWFRRSNVVAAGALNTTGSYDIIVGPVVEDSDFHHYAYVRSGNRHMLFMDGEEVASGELTADVADTSGIPMTIGAFRFLDESGFCCHFGGVIDEVEIFDRALTADEIRAIYNAGSAGKIKHAHGEIRGRMFRDLNANGIWDAGEPALPGWGIALDVGNDGTIDAETSTIEPGGGYSFMNIPPGPFAVWEENREGWVRTFPPDPGIHVGELGPGQVVEGLDFGNHLEAAEIVGRKFNDRNNNGQRDEGEETLPGWKIVIDLDGDGTGDLFTTTNFSYLFRNLPAGPFAVWEEPQPGWVQTFPLGGIHSGVLTTGDILELFFLNHLEAAEIHGRKFHDLNNNGVWEGDEPFLEGWEIVLDLDGDGTGDLVTTTNEFGAYWFQNLPAGHFNMWERQQPGWVQTAPAGGTYSGDLVIGDIVRGMHFGNAEADPIPPPEGMVSWWPGDGNAEDIVDGNDGSLQGGAGFAAGLVDQAFSMDGADDYVLVPDSASLDLTDQFTLDAWINPSGLHSAGPTSGPLISKIGGAGGNNGYQLGIRGNNAEMFCEFNAAGEPWPTNALIVTLPSAIPMGQWSHVACVYDNADLKIYVDGVLVGTQAIGAKSVVNSASNVRIGSNDNNDHFFHGVIDEVEIFNRALTADEIRAIYNAGSAGKVKEAVFNPSNWHYYGVVRVDGINWADADAAAVSRTFAGRQGHLATITSEQEQGFIVDNFPVAAAGCCWLGGFQPNDTLSQDADPAAGWEWVTGEPFNFTSWAEGEPNDGGGLEDGVTFDHQNPGNWNDIPRTFEWGGYIVEYE